MIAISLILSTAIPAFAGTDAGKGLEQAIGIVKNVVSISSDYKDFQYSSSEYEENGKSVSVWYLNWYTEDYSAGISATVEDGGYLISYYSYTDQENTGLGTVSKDAGAKTAVAFLAKARPDFSSSMKLTEKTSYSGSDRNTYVFDLYKNDVKVNYINAYVDVNKYTGQVNSFNFQGSDEAVAGLESTDGVIGLDAAKAAYLEKLGMELQYHSTFDYDTKTLSIFSAYSPVSSDKVIDSKTGQIVNLYNDYRYYGDMGGAGGMYKTSESVTQETELTKEELEAVDNLSGLITKAKAESILRGKVPGITSKMKVTSSSLSKNYVDTSKYVWQIGFDGAYGVVNASTGDLESFYIYTEDSSDGSANLSEERAKTKAETFMKQIAPEQFEQSAYYENPYYSIYTEDEDVTDYSFNYYRQVNGIKFVDNGFTVIVNKASGLITHYDCNWYNQVEFPSVEKAISSEVAFDKINQTGEMGLVYTKINEGETGLVYDFSTYVGDYLLDPINGTRIGWDGKPYQSTELPEYNDISGHWAEATILKLLDNGYYLEGDSFKPKENITQMAFLRYLYSPIQGYYNDEEFYDLLISDKILDKGAAMPNGMLSRQEAAKYLVRYLGQGKSGEHWEIFVNPFQDKVTDAYRGYAAISYGLEIIQGDKNGRFNGTNAVTRAEAATMIYNTLQVQ